MRSELTKLAEEKIGDQMLFDLITKVKDFAESLETPQTDTPLDTEEPEEVETPKTILDEVEIPEIYGTDILTDRKSVFQAHIGKITSKEQVTFISCKGFIYEFLGYGHVGSSYGEFKNRQSYSQDLRL